MPEQYKSKSYAAWQRARPPVLTFPGAAPSGAPLIHGIRSPVLPRPIPGAPVYGTAPFPSSAVPWATATPGSDGTSAAVQLPMYQAIKALEPFFLQLHHLSTSHPAAGYAGGFIYAQLPHHGRQCS
ncbi:hypothetical protein Nepgr_010194 [Nepenthes gracilis]|uniref:Uncharacterized protein n=1 Tax=Nepenthes gracilis TaxID=150966 RepID=A0AAD3XL31_NEPGR|nr:hypothetical protein Nepgr_010194 [Nepenthes gracilis]